MVSPTRDRPPHNGCRGQRRIVTDTLRQMRRVIVATRNDWDIPATTWEHGTDGQPVPRLRRPEELPENRHETWEQLARRAQWLADTASRLAVYARQQEQKGRSVEQCEGQDSGLVS